MTKHVNVLTIVKKIVKAFSVLISGRWTILATHDSVETQLLYVANKGMFTLRH